MRTFYHLHTLTRKRIGLPPQPRGYFEALRAVLSENGACEVMLAWKGTEAVAGLVLLKHKGRVSVEFAASEYGFHRVSPTHLLFWIAIQRACAEGYRVFDFGRTWVGNEGLMQFKNRWGTTVTTLPSFTLELDGLPRRGFEEESKRYRWAKAVSTRTPTFALPWLGELCYRHLA